MSAIDAYLAELIGGLSGSPRHLRDIASETRSGLEELADEYRSRTTSREDAESLAVAEFGTVEILGPAFQEMLAIKESRHTALITTMVIAMQPLVWGYPYDLATGGTASQFGSVHGGLSIAVAAVGVAAATFMLWALAISHADGTASRRHIALARRVGRTAIAATVVIGMFGVALGAVSMASTGPPTRVMAVWAIVFLFAPLALAARAARRALDTAPALTPRPA